MSEIQVEQYQTLMEVIKSRFDALDELINIGFNNFSISEVAAFHGRKVIEGIAFACLISTKNGFKTIPKEAIGQYNAEKIFKTLIRKNIEIFPSPSLLRIPTDAERKIHDVKIIIDGIPDLRITQSEMISKYQRMHNWLHELNPFTKDGHKIFNEKYREQLLKDLNQLKAFLSSHFISINGEAFYCTLSDKVDNTTKVIALSRFK